MESKAILIRLSATEYEHLVREAKSQEYATTPTAVARSLILRGLRIDPGERRAKSRRVHARSKSA